MTEQTVRLIKCANAYRAACDDVATGWKLLMHTEPDTDERKLARDVYNEAMQRQSDARLALTVCARGGGV